jgi:general secretion pathway protein G
LSKLHLTQEVDIFKGGIMFKKKGFTLIELMLVVIILGVLVAMVVPRLTGRSEEARRSVARADIDANISLALDLYELDNGTYPPNLEALLTKPSYADNWRGPYLKKKPIDPWGNPYQYRFPGQHNVDGYDLSSLGRDAKEGGGDDVTNWE